MFPRPQLHFFRLCTAWPLTLLALVASCGTATFVVQQYDGAPLPKQRIAVVRLNGDQPLRLEELDGEKLGYELRDSGARVHIEVLPGEHELGIAEGPGMPLKRRRFRAEPGRVYRPMLVRTTPEPGHIVGPWVIGIYEVDRSSDQVLREISQLPLPPPGTHGAPTSVPPTAPTPVAPIPSAVPPSAGPPSAGPAPNPPAQQPTPPNAHPTDVPSTPVPDMRERLPSSTHPTENPPTPLVPPRTESPPTERYPNPVPSGVAPATGPEPAPPPAPASPL